MPSVSFEFWKTDRKPRLRHVSIQCTSSRKLTPPNPQLEEENIRAYIMLLSAHFQGYCRDLYTECTQAIATTVSGQLRFILQQQFTANRKLDAGNPSIDNLKKDFGRFGFKLDIAAADSANRGRLIHLSNLNRWRNIAAHHGDVPVGGLPSEATIQGWENSCDGLAVSLDRIMYNRLMSALGSVPWTP